MREVIPNVPFQMLLRGAYSVGYANYPDNSAFDGRKPRRPCLLRLNGGNAHLWSGDLGARLWTASPLTAHHNSTDIVGLRGHYPGTAIHVHTHDTAGAGVAPVLVAAEAAVDVVNVARHGLPWWPRRRARSSTRVGVAGVRGSGRTRAGGHHHRLAGIDLQNVFDYSEYWEVARQLYTPFDCTATMKSGNSDVYENEIPGGQYTNLHFQAHSMGVGHKFKEVKKAYADANKLLGDLIKVTPLSMIVGDLALQNGLTRQEVSLPKSVVEFMQGTTAQQGERSTHHQLISRCVCRALCKETHRTGECTARVAREIGDGAESVTVRLEKNPAAVLRPIYLARIAARMLKDMERTEGRPGASLPPLDFVQLEKDPKGRHGRDITPEDVVSASVSPQARECAARRARRAQGRSARASRQHMARHNCAWDSREALAAPALDALRRHAGEFAVSPRGPPVELERGKTLIIKALALGDLDKGHREVFFELNGELRSVLVKDTKAMKNMHVHPKALKSVKGQVGASMPGSVIEIKVKEGQQVEKGQPLCVLSAMKTETVVNAPMTGKITKLHVQPSMNPASNETRLDALAPRTYSTWQAPRRGVHPFQLLAQLKEGSSSEMEEPSGAET
ncbi:unnamed protein product [Lampetra planeri]